MANHCSGCGSRKDAGATCFHNCGARLTNAPADLDYRKNH